MGRRLLNLGLITLLGPLLVVLSYQGVLFLASIVTWEATMWFLAGAGLGLGLYFLLLNGKIDFVEHVLHEFEHATVAFVFSGKLPTKMEIDPSKKSSITVSTRGGCLTTLGPYYLPLLTLPFLVFKAVVALVARWLGAAIPAPVALGFDLLIGATLAFHYAVTVKEYGGFQTDIKKEGWIPSLVVVLFLNLAILIVTLTVVTGAYAEFWAYVQTAAAATVEGYRASYEYVTTRLVPGLEELTRSFLDDYCESCTPTPGP